MDEYYERLHILLEEIKEITYSSLGVSDANIPKSFFPEEQNLASGARVGQKFFKLMNQAVELFKYRGKDNFDEKKVKDFVKALQDEVALNIQIFKDRIRFTIDQQLYELRVERQYFVYLAVVLKDNDLESYLMGTTAEMVATIKLLLMFEDLLIASDEMKPEFNTFKEQVIKIADKFLPKWKDYIDKPFPEETRLNEIYISKYDALELSERFQQRVFGQRIEEVIGLGNGETNQDFIKSIDPIKWQEYFKYSSSGQSQDANHEFRKLFETVFSEGRIPVHLFEDNPKLQQMFQEIVGKYTYKNKFLSLKKELESLEHLSIQLNAEAIPRNRFPLIKDAILKNQQDLLDRLLSEITPDDKQRLNQYLLDQENQFFMRHRAILIQLYISEQFSFSDDLRLKAIPILFSDINFVLGSEKSIPELETEIELSLKEKLHTFEADLQQYDDIVKEAETIGEELANQMFEQNKERLSAIIEGTDDKDQLVESVSDMLTPRFLSNLDSLLIKRNNQ